MKSKKPSLIVKILVAALAGWVLGRVLPGWGIRGLNNFQSLFSQFVKFLVPLIILGFVTPAIADTGKSAGRTLLATLCIAYASTIFAGALSFTVSRAILPHIMCTGLDEAAASASYPAYFKIAIPPFADIVTCLVFSFILGMGIIACKADAVHKLTHQFRDIVTWSIVKLFVPLLPLYILSVVANTTACGNIAAVAGSCMKLVLYCTALTMTLLVIQYSIACSYARKNPFKALWNMMPAYLTGLGCASSAATLPVTLRQTRENGVSEPTANLVIPLCANIHLAGSMCNMVAYAVGLMVMAGEPISAGAFVTYIFQISVVAVAAPGVPGGVVLACATIAETSLGFSPERYAMMTAIYLAFDGMGTACNLTGDGAIAIAVDKISGKIQPE
jgi:Na+/H+-dicarboxylate symporter